MSFTNPLLLSFLLILTITTTTTSASSVNELLEKYGLPKGLLPDTVKKYTLTNAGEFEVQLLAPCYVHFSRLVYYDKTIKGKISYGAITGLSGIQAKKFFIWASVDSIKAHPDEGTIEFFAGFISETLSVKEFEKVPVCKANAGFGRGGFFPEELLPAVSEGEILTGTLL